MNTQAIPSPLIRLRNAIRNGIKLSLNDPQWGRKPGASDSTSGDKGPDSGTSKPPVALPRHRPRRRQRATTVVREAANPKAPRISTS